MERRELNVEVRTGTNKGESRRLRAKNKVPGIFYGPQLDQPIPLSVTSTDLTKAMQAGSNTLFTLKAEASSPLNGKMAMVKDEQFHPLSSARIHVDFYEVRLDQKIRVNIPVVLVGKAEGTAEGGILQTSLRELEVRCLPNDIPEKIEVDVTALKIGDSIHVSDIKLPKGITVYGAVDYTVAAVVPPEKEEVAATAVAAGDVAVIGESPEAAAAAAAESAKAGEKGGKAEPAKGADAAKGAPAKGAAAKAEPAKAEKKK